MAGEFFDHVAQRRHECGAVEAGRPGQMIAPAGFLVGLVSVGEGGRDQSPDFSRDATAESDGTQDDHVHRPLVAVLLPGAYGWEDRQPSIPDTAIIFPPCRFKEREANTPPGHTHAFITQ